jgi:hypothetical protein
MKPWRMAGRLLAGCAVSLLIIVLAPAVLLFGEAVNRRYWRGIRARHDRILVWRRRGRRRVVVRRLGPRQSAATVVFAGRRGRLARMILANPLWIALTAPARWLLDHLRPRARGRGGNGPPGAGVREPRRPLPDLPAGAMALPEPYPEP